MNYLGIYLNNILQNQIKKTMCAIKTVEDLFLDDSTNVYHFFPWEYKDSILENGLLCSNDGCNKKGEKKGIYVIWKNDERILSAIAETQASVRKDGSIVDKLGLCTINLKQYGISPQDIAPDLNGGENPDINSFCCKIVRDIVNIKEQDITEWSGGNADTYGIVFYNLKDYNIAHKPKDYDYMLNFGMPNIQWKNYDENTFFTKIFRKIWLFIKSLYIRNRNNSQAN